MVQEIDEQGFTTFIKGTTEIKVVIVDFSATWCGPCKSLKPILEELEMENENVAVGLVNLDTSQDVARQYEIMSVPTVIFFQNGKEVDRFVGLSSKSRYQNVLGKLLVPEED